MTSGPRRSLRWWFVPYCSIAVRPRLVSSRRAKSAPHQGRCSSSPSVSWAISAAFLALLAACEPHAEAVDGGGGLAHVDESRCVTEASRMAPEQVGCMEETYCGTDGVLYSTPCEFFREAPIGTCKANYEFCENG